MDVKFNFDFKDKKRRKIKRFERDEVVLDSNGSFDFDFEDRKEVKRRRKEEKKMKKEEKKRR